MCKDEWSPDPEIIKLIEDGARGLPTGKILRKGKILTWQDVVREVKEGTGFGRAYYQALCETIRRTRN